MTRGLFFLAMGAAAGVVAVRRASRAARHLTPAGLQSDVTGFAGGLQARVLDFADQVRIGMAERERELRTGLGLDGSHDVVDTNPSYAQAVDPNGQHRAV